MLRILIILVVVCLLWRWALGQWPWAALAAKPTRNQAVLRARKLLQVGEGASRDDIKVAHKRLLAMVHPDRGGSNAEVHEANAARDLLLEELPDKDGDMPSKSEDTGPSQD